MYAFELHRAKSVADAAATLGKTGGKALAGGQSLVAAMKLRLAQPGHVVDLSGLAELKGIRKDGDARDTTDNQPAPPLSRALAAARVAQCPKCGEAALAFQEGCATCLACGHSTCS